MPDHPYPVDDQPAQPDFSRLRRVIIEERQQKTLEHVRSSAGYADDVSPHAHSAQTFRLINQRKELDKLPGPTTSCRAGAVEVLDQDERLGLAQPAARAAHRQASPPRGDCRQRSRCSSSSAARRGEGRASACAATAARRSTPAQTAPSARGGAARQRARPRQLDQVIQHALLDALLDCPRPLPRRFFPWLEKVLAHRALDHVRQDLAEARHATAA